MRSAGRSSRTVEGPALLIGVVSDTHGYVDPQLETVFHGVERILHAGDIGTVAVLEALERIAPVLAVRGNVDRSGALDDLPERIDAELGGVMVHLVHQLPQARPRPDTVLLIFGHSHRALVEWREQRLYLNPGAAGRQGFHSVRTAALLRLGENPQCEIRPLGPRRRT